MVWERLANKH